MLFIKNEDLRVGMRLAKPIYNKKGVLLYDRNSKLTDQGIDSVKNFGLIGLYILEPAEPLPPMSEDDIEFERFQTVMGFQIQDELNMIVNQRKSPKIQQIAAEIIRRYGRLSRKINFVQNLRSTEDFVYKHSLNCAILCAMIAHVMNIPLSEQTDAVIAAIVHDVGKLTIPKDMQATAQSSDGNDAVLAKYERDGFSIIDDAFLSSPSIRRIAQQCNRFLADFRGGNPLSNGKVFYASKILMVAETFDTMTAMNDYREPSSEIAALRFLQEHDNYFDPTVVKALVKSINILTNGCCVELNNGEKGLVISANDDNVLLPIVLCFGTNQIVDLYREGKSTGLEIKDVMKTMDNRCVMDKDALGAFGS